jgi:5-methylcytosine-specific restriction endonuclease McrA
MFKKGYTMAEETKAKIRATERGRQFSAEHRAKISRAKLGHPVNAGTRAKLRAAFVGKKQSAEQCAKKSLANRGEKNYFWRGGIHTPYGLEFNATLKSIVRDRDGHLCQSPECYLSENGKAHNVHHIDFCKWNNDPFNLLTLCTSCHSKTNRGNRDHWIEYYQALQVIRGLGRSA